MSQVWQNKKQKWYWGKFPPKFWSSSVATDMVWCVEQVFHFVIFRLAKCPDTVAGKFTNKSTLVVFTFRNGAILSGESFQIGYRSKYLSILTLDQLVSKHGSGLVEFVQWLFGEFTPRPLSMHQHDHCRDWACWWKMTVHDAACCRIYAVCLNEISF